MTCGPTTSGGWTTLSGMARALLGALILCGCSQNLDSAMWDCQLEVQKGNAGKSAEAAAERGREITACMGSRGYRLDVSKRSCQEGSVTSGCYLAR